eukprot:CAMPEP_0173229048 /NCGR_PEP_ID=MMETSP1142-20121109/6881_1 /TAXON_ID=483371 /ORGANISM="non described non described, Strain CCMP2298" /LENGTH=98 /DNA_ID=CAMNT_0014157789 /DNA_START=446 /DNA_END=739 /DNA_ORIENTATION=-
MDCTTTAVPSSSWMQWMSRYFTAAGLSQLLKQDSTVLSSCSQGSCGTSAKVLNLVTTSTRSATVSCVSLATPRAVRASISTASYMALSVPSTTVPYIW